MVEPSKKNPIERAKFHPDKLNEEGKKQLAFEIIEKMNEEELDNLLLKLGWKE